MITIITIGDVLILEPKYSDKFERYKCKIVEIEENKLFIDYPINMETNKSMFLLDGMQLKASFVHKESVYMFESEIIGRVKRKIPMLVLTYDGDDQLVKIQRRQFVRVESSVDVAIHALDHEIEPFTAVTEDISAGGACILTIVNDSIKQGMLLQTLFVITMQNGEYHYLHLRSKVIRIIQAKENWIRLSLQFIEINAQERQILLRYSFDRQVAMKKKGIDS